MRTIEDIEDDILKLFAERNKLTTNPFIYVAIDVKDGEVTNILSYPIEVRGTVFDDNVDSVDIEDTVDRNGVKCTMTTHFSEVM